MFIKDSERFQSCQLHLGSKAGDQPNAMGRFQLDQLNLTLLAFPLSFHIHPFRYFVVDDFGHPSDILLPVHFNHPYDILLRAQAIANIYHLAFDQEVRNIP